MTRVFAAVAIFQLLLGCGTQQMYEGSKRLPEQIALLKPGSPTVLSSLANDPALVIDEIDGNPPRQRVTVDTPIFEVLPGKHRVKATLVSVSASYVSRSPSKIIEFEVEAGEAYTIFYRWRNRRESDWILFVKEDRTGNVIGINSSHTTRNNNRDSSAPTPLLAAHGRRLLQELSKKFTL